MRAGAGDLEGQDLLVVEHGSAGSPERRRPHERRCEGRLDLQRTAGLLTDEGQQVRRSAPEHVDEHDQRAQHQRLRQHTAAVSAPQEQQHGDERRGPDLRPGAGGEERGGDGRPRGDERHAHQREHGRDGVDAPEGDRPEREQESSHHQTTRTPCTHEADRADPTRARNRHRNAHATASSSTISSSHPVADGRDCPERRRGHRHDRQDRVDPLAVDADPEVRAPPGLDPAAVGDGHVAERQVRRDEGQPPQEPVHGGERQDEAGAFEPPGPGPLHRTSVGGGGPEGDRSEHTRTG